MDIQCIIKSKSGKDISLYNENEKEVLFQRDTNFIIMEVKDNIIYMEEV